MTARPPVTRWLLALVFSAAVPVLADRSAAGDARHDLPLLPMMAEHQKMNMRGHLEAVRSIVAALATEDFAAIERAARRMGYSDDVGQMCIHMGAAAPGFSEQALAFHHSADRIADAARTHDRAQVVTQLSATLGRCTACHAQWKQKIVDGASWEKLRQAAVADSN